MINILRNRRSVREFEDKAIESEKIEILKEALVRSPSSRSINPWEFIFVQERQIIRDLACCKSHGAAFVAAAPLAVVVLGDTDRSDTCIEDCSIAAITLQYTAEVLGLSSCWCQVRMRSYGEERSAEEYICGLLGIPSNYMVECVIAVGYPVRRGSPHPFDGLAWEKIRNNRF